MKNFLSSFWQTYCLTVLAVATAVLVTWWLTRPGAPAAQLSRWQVRAALAAVSDEQAQAARDTAAAARADTAAWRAYNAGRAAGRAAERLHRQTHAFQRRPADTTAGRLQQCLAGY